jgi:hypothetical protein
LIEIKKEAVNRLMPMHVSLTSAGQVGSVGSTLHKVFVGLQAGTSFFQVFEVRRPGAIFTVADLRNRSGQRLQIVPTDGTWPHGLRGLAVPIMDGGVLLNL